MLPLQIMAPPALLITDVRIFDGEHEIPSGSVLVRDGTIIALSGTGLEHASPDDRGLPRGPPASSVPSSPPLSVTAVSRPGHTLMPRLIDGHAQAVGGMPAALTQSLRLGITTLCDIA